MVFWAEIRVDTSGRQYKYSKHFLSSSLNFHYSIDLHLHHLHGSLHKLNDLIISLRLLNPVAIALGALELHSTRTEHCRRMRAACRPSCTGTHALSVPSLRNTGNDSKKLSLDSSSCATSGSPVMSGNK